MDMNDGKTAKSGTETDPQPRPETRHTEPNESTPSQDGGGQAPRLQQ